MVDQSPGQLVQNVIANTGTKVVHQLPHPLDIQELSYSIGLTDTNDLIFLPVGQCFCKFESGQPVKENVVLWQDRRI